MLAQMSAAGNRNKWSDRRYLGRFLVWLHVAKVQYVSRAVRDC